MFGNLIPTALKKRVQSKRGGRGRPSTGLLQSNRLVLESLEPRIVLSSYTALQRPTELQYWDPNAADNGYNFYGAGGTSYLLDMEGKVVHTWPVGTNPHLLSNGDVLDTSTDDPSGFSGFKEVDWSGNTVWSYTESRSTYHPHHDFTRIFNPKLNAYTTLYIANKDLTYDQLIAAGANPATTPTTGAQMDAIVEVDSSGTIVWEWCFFDHLVQDFNAAKSNYVDTGKTVANYPGKLDINLDGHSLKADWLHCNSLDYNQSLDQIVVNSVQGEFYVIDHGGTFTAGNPTASIAAAATSAGDFLYRFGDPARYDQGSKPSILEDWTQSTTGNKQLGGAHDIQWIADGLTGAGHFLIFNNAEYLSEHTSQSYVMEIDPYLDASGSDTGHYVNPPDAGYNTVTSPEVTDKAPKLISKQVVWNYSTESNLTLYSQIGCSAQRLPNGNTLICADTEGYIMEVTPTGETVWDYIVPITSSGKVLVIGDNLPMVNSIFRAYRYEASNSAFSGRTLTPGATIAGRTTVANPYAGTSHYDALQRQTETQYWDSTNAYNGYTFFGAQGTTYLLDMQGRKVNTWATGTDPRLLDSGNVLDWATNISGNTGLKELDWSGNTVWQYYETRSSYHPHGDFQRIYDPKLGAYATLYLANKDVTAAECIAAGCDPADAPYDGAQVDTIVEVDMSGNIVWEWSFWDHAIQSVDATKANYVATGQTIADYPGKINLNLPGRPLQSNWLDCNSLDFNPSLNQIVVNSRQGEFYVIDHGNTFLAGNSSGSIALAATTAGDFLYRFGDPARYSQGSAPSVGTNWETASSGNKQIGGSSNVQWIASGLPGAGHLLVFDNNQYLYERTPQSYVFEINPYLNSSGVDTGAYVNPPTAGYNTWTFDKDTMKANQLLSKQVVWKYGSVSNLTLFSHLGSSAQRLPNGNTLICATTEGYMVEVDTSGNVVWEYINPVTDAGIVTAIGDDLPMTNAVPRAVRYAASFAGFTGHSLTPEATITGNVFPTITTTTHTPSVPSASDAVWITSQITDDGSIAGAKLTYLTGSGTPTTTTVFTETMTATAVKPWTGTGAVNAWTVTGSYFETRSQANYGTGNACGVEYKGLVTNNGLTSAMLATTNGITATGTSGYVEFYILSQTLDGTDGWTFQLDSGSGYVTRLSELTGSSHTWQKYHYDLDDTELVSGLKMRFQFTGGGTGDLDDRIDLDQITVTTVSGGGSTSTVTMYDDGEHGDGASDDHIYGGQIPAMALGTTVSYYVTATDNSGFTTTDPATAPTDKYSYTVQNNAAPTVATAANAMPSPVTGTTTALAALGADVDTGEASLTYTWTATTVPSGATALSFSINGTNAAKGTTVTFSQAGSYTFQVAITDPGSLSATSTVSVTVNQALTTIVVSPASVSLNTGATQQFTASAKDQFNNVLTTQPTFTWTTTVTGGTISTSGLFTAPSTAASGTVTATSGGISGNGSVSVSSQSHPYTMAALPDTGQVASLSTLLGEDSDYTVNPPTYKDNGAGTVTDKVTGLMWQQVDGGEMTWEQAAAYANSLTLGGYSDWRLPFSRELFSIQDESTINPALNTKYFPASTAEYWWSGDTAVDDATKVWVTNAGGGIGPHPKTETISAGGTKHFHVRCVRELSASGATHLYGDLTGNVDGTVTDNHTGLVWQQAESATMTWEQALAYAENLTLAGHSDWRLPNIKELQSVSDTNFRAPSLDRTYFPGATATRYWSSTTMANSTLQAWYLDSDYGLTSYDVKTGLWHVRCVRGGTPVSVSTPELEVIPQGSFVMGDHFNYTDPGHPTDEKPLHTVAIDAFYLGTYDITNAQYRDYLTSALAQSLIEVRSGVVYGAGSNSIYCETRSSTLYSVIDNEIVWDGTTFSVVSGRENHPMVSVRWEGAAAYCNWLSAVQGYQPCYNLTTWATDFAKSGYRLPTEAEWEYAANGGVTYAMFPWGDYPNTDGTWANWQTSGDPYETGDYPQTTPVGFYNGQLHLKSEFNWPGSATSYQTSNAVNGYGLYDMAGNVWQWTNDWFANAYYSVSPSSNPPGPTTGDAMPDGNAYRVLRGGNWYNGAEYYGHARIANRDPAYYRGPEDPNHPYYHVGFRVALKSDAIAQPRATDKTLVNTLTFGEGPATDASGNVFFSDISANTIYKWSTAEQLSVFRTNSGGANGLAFDASGNLIACEGTNGRIVSISPQGTVTVLASQYNGTRFNEPNDLWIAPNGGIYFTDPVFFGTQVQDGQHVYYISPDRSTVTRVISDMTKPNGLIGTSDGNTLYVSDYGAGATYKYTINANGMLTGKTLFVSLGSDGMEIDQDGNVYLTTDDVFIYNSSGIKIDTINVLDRPTNLCFAGADRRTLFISTEKGFYSIPLRVQGETAASGTDTPPTITGTTRTPTVPSATDAVWVTSTVTDDSSVASVKLTYVTGSGTGTTTTPFTETMGTTAVKPWTGATGSANAWTVTGNYFELRTGANYVTSTTDCGLEYKAGGTLNSLTAAMMATTNAINAAGTAGSVEFYVQTLTLDSTDGWTFQVDSGSGFVTRLSELTGSSHAYQKYHYDLASSELVSTLKLRFQFAGGGTADDDRIDVDQITVSVTTGTLPVEVTMYDDGSHGDGTAGDHVYGGQIPVMATGTTVSYYVTATDDAALTTTDPATAPTDKYSYIVGHVTPTLQLNEFMAASTSFIATTDYPTATVGLSINTTGALDGYTLLDPMHGKTTYLIDNAGQIVHTWTSEYEPGRTAYLMPNGHLFRACMAPGQMSTGGGEGGRIEERDWDGNLVWYLDYASSTYMMHHDFKVLPNGNIIMLVVEKMLYADVIAAGFNPSLLDSSIATDGYLLPDSVVEVQPSGTSGGTVVWEWHVKDHLIQDYDATKANYGVVAQHPELIDANGPGIKIPEFWNHFNGIDYNAALDQVMLSARNQNEVWIIDHSTTMAQAAGHTGGTHGKGGDLLYRWGDPRMYDAGTVSNRMLYEQHNTQWIASGSPGAGNILVFNNGLSRPAGAYSTIDEFTPPVDSSGNYAYTAGSAYGPAALTWTYAASPPTNFYSAEISGVERLVNGNTLICEGLTGRIFEVTSAGQIVWQYQNPVYDAGILDQGGSLPADPRGGYMTAVFRALKYPSTYAAFTSHTLTASGTVEVYPDWIELRNPGTSAVDLSGMYLTNDTSTPKKFQIPTGVSIPAGGYLLFWADNNTAAGSRHTNFTLDSAGGTITLYDIDGITRVDTVTYGDQPTNVSYGRYPNGTGDWQSMTTPTPGAANVGSSGTNEAPTDIALSASLVAENLPSGTTIGTLTTTDPNVGNTFTYSLVSGTGSDNNVSFNISGSTLQTAASFDYETKNSYSIRIRSTDQGGLFTEKVFAISVTNVNDPPVILATSRTPMTPTQADAVWVTSTVTDDGSVSGVTLTYSTGSGTPTTSTVFTETFGTTAVKPWTGATGLSNPWTVTGNYSELRTGSNYVTSTTECGMEYKGGPTLNTLTSAMVATSNAINAAGTSAYVEFWIQTLTLDTTDGWTFQLDSGSGYVTRLSELTGSSHAWQKYHYDLASGELVNMLKMRFQFTGGGTGDDDRIDLDQITVSVTSGGTATLSVTMYDDGAHGDAAAGDHVYGSQIPSMALGTTVSYYVTVTDNGGLTTMDPATAPTVKYSYTVQANQAPTDIAISAGSVTENQSVGTAVGTFSTTNPNAGNTFTYSLVSGIGSSDNSSFTISGSTLQTTASFNYETKNSYSIRVRSTDQGGLYFEKVFTISVMDVNEVPTDLTLSANIIAENQPAGTVVGTLSTTDSDAGNTFTYSLVGGTGSTDNASFSISGSTLQTAKSFDYETKNSFSVRVRSTDQGGLYVEEAYTITVTTDPVVAAMLVENGLTERSYVDQMTIQFNKSVTSTAIPMTLTNFGTERNLIQSVALTASQFHWTTVPGTGVSVLAWSLDSFAGGTTSLPDGYYELRLPNGQITDLYGLPLDGDGDGHPGGDYVTHFFVLQGDVSGDGVVDNNDISAVNDVSGSRLGSSNWNPNADVNRDGYVTVSDRMIVYYNLNNLITPSVQPTLAASLPAWSFDSTTQLTTTNDLPVGSPVSGVTFNADADPFVLSGNAVELNGDITNLSTNTQTINLPLTLIGDSRTIDTTSGDLTIAGSIGQSGGGFGITKSGAGTLVLSGVNTYSGGTTVLGGVLQVTNSGSLPDGGSLTICAGGTLVFGSSQSTTAQFSASSLVATMGQSSTPLVTGGQPMSDLGSMGTITTASTPIVASPGSASIVMSPAVVVSPAVGAPVLPAVVPGSEVMAPVVSFDYLSRQVANLSHGVPADVSKMVPPQAVIGRPIANDDFGAENHARAHDAVLQSFNTRIAVKEEKAAALWNLAMNRSNGQPDRKHDSVSSAVDAVMAMLERM